MEHSTVLRGNPLKSCPVLIFADSNGLKFYRLLRTEGQNICFAEFKNSLEYGPFENIELVIIDCGFDIKKGLHLLRKIKNDHPGIIVVIVTDESSEDNAIVAFRSGAREYLRKPASLPQLEILISRLMKLKKTSKEKRVSLDPSEVSDSEGSPDAGNPGNRIPLSILKAIRYIEDSMTTKIDLAKCAEAANLSKYHFCREFKRFIGVTPLQWVKFKRVTRAKLLLDRQDMSVDEIAHAAGFSDYRCFLRNFKKITQQTPSDYRDLRYTKHRGP